MLVVSEFPGLELSQPMQRRLTPCNTIFAQHLFSSSSPNPHWYFLLLKPTTSLPKWPQNHCGHSSHSLIVRWVVQGLNKASCLSSYF